ncbi:sugar ABC transporter ATP-binding protein [Caballeronia sp. M1242]|uniref:sugar ABC transporter ATP-binding protein n=1 Tax=Caballeronia sp. M1242 TaxID=2814653 RepID=UPI0019D2FF37|nr:sugar ABC transporter ATP-binding protein [Caballeronia sp. M1242]QSN64587.1 sugar ABC transporter ATP-binding protein [Caballeronia sp. M1242]
MSLLIAKGLTKRYDGVLALDDASLTLEAGEVLGLLGANGSGKSTLSSILAGDRMPDHGTIELDGAPLAVGSPKAARAAGIAIAHQHPGLAPDLPVWENVFLGAELCRAARFLNQPRTRDRALQLLESLRPGWNVDAAAGSLTAADQQLVEIARALALAPRVLILDEPTAALAAAEVDSLMRAVRGLTARGTAVVFISHRMAEIESLCDRVMVLCNGRAVGELPVRGHLDEPRVLELMGGVAGGAAAAHLHDDAHETAQTNRVSRNGASVAMTVRGLRAGARLRGVDLELKRGEILGIAGLQGHGQEELLDALAGFRVPDGGTVTLAGPDGPKTVEPRSPRQMIAAGVCLVPNDRHRQGLWLDHSVEFNLAQVGVNFAQSPWRLHRAPIRRFVDDVVKRLRIKTTDARQPVRDLSGGNQQKVVIGRWLNRQVDVLLLSDPTKGVDVIARKDIYEAIGALAAAGTAVLVHASDTEELLAVCDRLVVMYEGRIVALLEGDEMNESRVTSALFGRSAA